MSDGHSHEDGSRDLGIVALINFFGFALELVGGILFGSVALLSDAFHMLFDMLAYALAYLATFVAERYELEDQYGMSVHRIEPLAAFVNGFLLLPMIGYIIWASYQRFLAPVQIDTIPVILISLFGLAVNIVSVFILHEDEMSLNEKGAFYHLLGDAGGSVAVIVSVVAIEITGIEMIDPIVAVGISVLILVSALKVLAGSGAIFMHRNPLDDLHEPILLVDGVSSIKCIHIWQICSQITVATVHAQTDSKNASEIESINKRIHDILSQNGVDHATVELRKDFKSGSHMSDHHH